MLKVIILTIFFISSPIFGLIENLYENENQCYSGCQSNYIDNVENFNVCKLGCDFKLHHEKCADQCKLLAVKESVQASCVVGCSMNHQEIKQSNENSPHIHSVLLIRLRQHSSSNSNPIKTFNNLIEKLKQNSNLIEQTNEIKPFMNLVKTIPLIKSSNEDNTKHYQHIIIHENPRIDHIQNYMTNLPMKFNHFVSKQSNILSVILLSLLLIVSIIISYKIILLCWKTPKYQNLSIQAQEVFLEKDINQPVKVNLTNI